MGEETKVAARATGEGQGTANGRLRLALGKLRDTLASSTAAPLGAPEPLPVRETDR